jgi:hypothetical protein
MNHYDKERKEHNQQPVWPKDNVKIETIGRNGLDSANDDLGAYFSQQDEINALKKENEHLKKRVEAEIKLKSKWKCKYDKIKPERKSIRTKKNQRALDLIASRENGDRTYSLAEIGRMLDIRYGTLKNMAYLYRQCIKK